MNTHFIHISPKVWGNSWYIFYVKTTTLKRHNTWKTYTKLSSKHMCMINLPCRPFCIYSKVKWKRFNCPQYIQQAWWQAVTTSHITLRPGQDGRHFGRQHFLVHFLEWKLFNFRYIFTVACYLRSNWQYGSIGSDNGLVLNKPLSDAMLLCCICVTLPQWDIGLRVFFCYLTGGHLNINILS